MPLIDLKTNLKDLKFGHDEYKGGSSQQPFIQTAVPATDQPLQTGASISGDNILQGAGLIALGAGAGAAIGVIGGSGFGFGSTGFTVTTLVGTAVGTGIGIAGATSVTDSSITGIKLPRAGTGGTDFLIRGGTLAANIVVDDVERLAKFFKTPNGALFTTKQSLLSRIAVKTQASGRLFNGGQYNPLGTLAQAGGNILGLHVNKQGLNPFSGLGEAYVPNQYFDAVKETNNTNAILFTNISISGVGNQNFSPIDISLGDIIGDVRNRLIGLYKDLVIDISPNKQNILSYQGGPNSFLGIGKTNIKFATNNFGAPLRTNNIKFNTVLTPDQLETVANEALDRTDGNVEVDSTIIPRQIDFRKILRETLPPSSRQTIIPNSPSYNPANNKTLEQRTNLGDPGKLNGKNLISYTNGAENENAPKGAASINSYDKINILPIYKDSQANEFQNTTDLIKFRIGVINNDTPNEKEYIHFRAFLDNITDNYKAEWKGTKYLGRGEDFYTYGGFDRSVSLSWTVAAQSKAELIPMYKKLNYLASICMPDYNAFGYMRGNMVTLTIGGYFYEQPGIITGFSYNMNEDNATWEIGINDIGDPDKSVKELPHLIKVSGFNFIPIHNFVPRKQVNNYNPTATNFEDLSEYGPQRYISLLDRNGVNSSGYGEIYRP